MIFLFAALMEGSPDVDSLCDTTISGRDITWLPKLQGSLQHPFSSPLLWAQAGPLQCSTSLKSAEGQSVILKVIYQQYITLVSRTRCRNDHYTMANNQYPVLLKAMKMYNHCNCPCCSIIWVNFRSICVQQFEQIPYFYFIGY